MKKIDLIASFKIHPEKIDEFKAWSATCIENVKAKDTSTLRYDWYFNADLSECVVLESYADSDAVMQHVGNLGDLLGKGLEISDLSGEIYGNPSEEVKQALSPLGVIFYTPLH